MRNYHHLHQEVGRRDDSDPRFRLPTQTPDSDPRVRPTTQTLDSNSDSQPDSDPRLRPLYSLLILHRQFGFLSLQNYSLASSKTGSMLLIRGFQPILCLPTSALERRHNSLSLDWTICSSRSRRRSLNDFLILPLGLMVSSAKDNNFFSRINVRKRFFYSLAHMRMRIICTRMRITCTRM